jgi:hypothetical protein
MSKNKDKDKGGNQRIGQAIAAAGKNLSGKDVKQIAKQTGYTPESIISRAEKTDVTIKPSAQSFVQKAIQTQTQAQQQKAQEAAPFGTNAVFFDSPIGSAVRYEPVVPPPQVAEPSGPSIETDFTNKPYLLEVEAIREQALQERDLKNKLDLQKIINAGYKSISNIERGSEMMRNITSMFNF